MADIHVYKNGKFIRVERNVEPGLWIDTVEDSAEEVELPLTRWPNAGEPGGAEL